MRDDIEIDYTNYRGERRVRRIRPLLIFWGKTVQHPKEQWLLDAWDVEKSGMRTYAMTNIHNWRETT